MVDEISSAGTSTPRASFNRVISNTQSQNLHREKGQNSVRPIESDPDPRPDEIEQIRSDLESQNANQVRIDSSASQPPSSSGNVAPALTLETSRTNQIDATSLENNSRETNTVTEEIAQRDAPERQAESETGNNLDRFA